MTAVLHECRDVQGLLEELLGGLEPEEINEDTRLQTTGLALQLSIGRNKRCLLAYHQARLEVVEELHWQTGNPVVEREFVQRLNEHEIDHYREYVELLSDTSKAFDLDLLQDVEPPKDLVVEVRALQDFGDVMTEFGSVKLSKNSTHFMRRADAEGLIRQGVLEQL